MTSTLNASNGDVKAEAIIFQQPAAEGSKPQDLAANLEFQGRSRSQRRRPPHSKRRASRHSKPLPKPQHVLYQNDEEMIIAHEKFFRILEEARPAIQEMMRSALNASHGDVKQAEVEAKIPKQPAAKMVVEPIAFTVFLSDSDEEAIVIAHEKYIRLLEEAGRDIHGDVKAEANLEIQGRYRIQQRRPPHSKRRASRHSKPWSKSQHVLFQNNEEAGPEIHDNKMSSTLIATYEDM
ncbi:PREDICTED: uncharacterized protein LOC104747037 isoform X2 [Camelina sativa]|nr:PREDICTED: uncharacterized protein LOC104747037 isoform X2 [Camelina sativa]